MRFEFYTLDELLMFLVRKYGVYLAKSYRNYLKTRPYHAEKFVVEEINGTIVIDRVSYIWVGNEKKEFIDRKVYRFDIIRR